MLGLDGWRPPGTKPGRPDGAAVQTLYLAPLRVRVKVSLSNRYIPSASQVANPPVTSGGLAGGFRSTFSALRHRNFRLFYVGHLLSLGGTWLQITALGWLVLELTDSTFWLGVVNAGTSLPILLFSLYAGTIADRLDKRTILIVAQSVAFLQALGLAVLTHLDVIGIGWIIVLVLTLGTANAFEIPTRQSFFIELVGERDLTSAIALNSSAFNGTRMIGPAIAGALIAAVGVAACFYGNAISYLAVLGGLLAIRRPRPERIPQTVSTWANIREGFSWIWHHRVARSIVLFVAAASVLVFPYTMLLPVFARDILVVGPEGMGWLYSATGAGALLGGLTLASITERVPRGRLLVLSATAFTTLVTGFALSLSFPVSLALLAAAGFAMILSTATANSLLQTLVPNGLRGRVMAVYVVMFLGMTPVGYLQAGAIARLFGARAALAAGSSLLLLLLLGTNWKAAFREVS
ncbi:MAG: MFS transporter [Gemmatimonas sp.]|nr:MFS transporter [Gemmatimonas sp.]